MADDRDNVVTLWRWIGNTHGPGPWGVKPPGAPMQPGLESLEMVRLSVLERVEGERDRWYQTVYSQGEQIQDLVAERDQAREERDKLRLFVAEKVSRAQGLAEALADPIMLPGQDQTEEVAREIASLLAARAALAEGESR